MEQTPTTEPADRSVSPGASSASRLRAYFTDRFVLPLPQQHRFPMLKYRRLRERITSEGILEPAQLFEPPAATDEQLCLVHTKKWVDTVREGRLDPAQQRRLGFPWSPELVERSRRSVGATIAAARWAVSNRGIGVNLAGGTHHAFPDRGEGFCVFNDVAVAIRTLQDEGLLRSALIVDCDVHQGDGTAYIFGNDPDVFTLSLHGKKNYPLRKQRSDLDVALDDGTGDDDYLARLAEALEKAHSLIEPDLVLYLAGADPYEGDRLGRLALSVPGLRKRDELVFGAATARGLPVVVTMAGGYSRDPQQVETICDVHAQTVHEARAASERLRQVPSPQ